MKNRNTEPTNWPNTDLLTEQVSRCHTEYLVNYIMGAIDYYSDMQKRLNNQGIKPTGKDLESIHWAQRTAALIERATANHTALKS